MTAPRWLISPNDERELLDVMRAQDTEPRFERPDRPAHTYARHSRAWLNRHLANTTARPDSHSGRAA